MPIAIASLGSKTSSPIDLIYYVSAQKNRSLAARAPLLAIHITNSTRFRAGCQDLWKNLIIKTIGLAWRKESEYNRKDKRNRKGESVKHDKFTGEMVCKRL
jgi:hypothetical protein